MTTSLNTPNTPAPGWFFIIKFTGDDGKQYQYRQNNGDWVLETAGASVKAAKSRNVYAEWEHIPLSKITAKNIYKVFAYCDVGGKMRCVRQVPASIDAKALTLEFMSPAEFKAAFVNRTEYEFVELQVLDPDTPPIWPSATDQVGVEDHQNIARQQVFEQYKAHDL